MFTSLLGNLMVRITAESTQFQKVLGDAEKELGKTTQKMMSWGGLMTKAITIPLVALGTFAVKTAAEFDHAMNRAYATFGNVSDALKARMEQNARSIAKDSVTSALDLAKAYTDLAHAGFNAGQAVDALGTVEKFAVANSLSMGEAISTLGDAQRTLGLKSNDSATNLLNLTKLANEMTFVTTRTGVSIEELAKSLDKHGGSAARRFKIPLEETLALLAGFAEGGAKAGQAGQYLADLLGSRRLGTRVGTSGDALNVLQKNLQFVKDMKTELEKISTGSIDVTGGIKTKTLDDFMGRWEKIGNRFRDIGIDVGRILEPAMDKLANVLERGIAWWDKQSASTKFWTVTIAVAVASIGPLVVGLATILSIGANAVVLFGALSSALTVFSGIVAISTASLGALWAMLLPIAIPLVGVAALTAAFGLLLYKIVQIVQAIRDLWNELENEGASKARAKKFALSAEQRRVLPYEWGYSDTALGNGIINDKTMMQAQFADMLHPPGQTYSKPKETTQTVSKDLQQSSRDFQVISLRRFALEGSGGLATHASRSRIPQEVHAKGVESKLDQLIQVTKEKDITAILK